MDITAVVGARDEELVESIASAIRQTTGGRIRGMRVEAEAESIVVSGITDSYYNKQLVTRVVLEKFSHSTLHNNISVVPPA